MDLVRLLGSVCAGLIDRAGRRVQTTATAVANLIDPKLPAPPGRVLEK
jgi:hypothetical protein